MVLMMRFGALDVLYDEEVLQPRAWTLAQAQWAAELVDGLPAGPVVELGAGVGHIGLALASVAHRDLVLVDANEAACALARRNADAAAIRVNVEVRHGQMTEVLAPSERFIFALADPPYVPSAETASFPGDPLLAIDGGQDGLDLARTCVEVIGAHLALEGEALLQLRDADQAERIATFIKTSPKLQLEVREVRVLGRGALVHLRREPPR